ncbi:MAG: PAS domain-containing sensor histidine kinase [Azoarcus sp.]|jgi:two-component system sensor histidine kinase PilS (NtrC family)|nr:PAS domain-containing sensor histidine kinase [Azoarcus sp.]
MNAVLAEADYDAARYRALRYFKLFRFLVAGFFLALGSRFGLGFEAPRLFWVSAFVYLLLVLALGLPGAPRRIGFARLMMLQCFIDLSALAIALATSGGYHSGIPVLMMIALAGSGLLNEGRIVLFMAALATVAVLVENSWRAFTDNGSAAGDFFRVALTCSSFFGIAIVARLLASRARSNATLAAARSAELAQQEAINAHIIHDMSDGVIVLHADGIVRQANPSACVLLGQARIEGRPLADIDSALAELCRRAGADELGQLITLGQTRRLLRCRVAGGSNGIEGDKLIYLTDLEDIQRRMQQLKLASLGRLTANMAHEIRNPLSAVTQAAELICEEKRGDVQARLARIIKDNARRIEHMIHDILALGRRERTYPEALPLAGFVSELLDEASLRGEGERAIFHADIDPALTLGIDRNHLRQILDNLLANARRHCSGKPSAICIEASETGSGQVSVHVRDDGPGLDEQARAHLFEPFFTSHAKGTGLGLYIARELAEANGFSLDLLDGGGPGAHFILTGRSRP